MDSPSQALEFAERILLSPNDLTAEALSTAAGAAGTKADLADIYLQRTVTESWLFEEGSVKSGAFDIDQGVGLRAVSGEATAFAYSDEIGKASIGRISDVVSAAAVSAGGESRIALAGNASPLELYGFEDPISEMTDSEKVDILRKVDAFARAEDPRVSNVIVSLAGQRDIVLVARSDGAVVADVRPLVRLSVQAILSDGGKMERGHHGGGRRGGYDFFSEDMLKEFAHEAVREATVRIGAVPAPAGAMPVVLGNGWAGILLHEAVGHGLEGDFNRKGQSAFSGKVGEQVAARGVTVIDDGTISGRRGSINCDDEGVPGRRNVLIEDGILKGYLQDMSNAHLMGVEPTGNGRRESYAHSPMPRMTNTFLSPGDKKPEEIIASVERGLYARNFSGGEVDITNGNFVFVISEAYLIENGKVGSAVKGATVAGNGPEAMRQVSMIADDFSLDGGIGTCGKNGQWVPVGVGQPTTKVDKLTVGGTA